MNKLQHLSAVIKEREGVLTELWRLLGGGNLY